MPELAATPPLALHPGRHGRKTGAAGLRLRTIEGRALVSVMTRKGSDAALADIAQRRFDVAPRPASGDQTEGP